MKRTLSGLRGPTTISQCNFVSASKLRAKCTPMTSDYCSLTMASATLTIFRPGRELLSLERK